MGDIEEAAAILGGVFAVAFGNVQRDRGRGSVQLLFYFAKSQSSVQDGRKPTIEGDGLAVNFEFFVIEPDSSVALMGLLLLRCTGKAALSLMDAS